VASLLDLVCRKVRRGTSHTRSWFYGHVAPANVYSVGVGIKESGIHAKRGIAHSNYVDSTRKREIVADGGTA